MKKTFSIFLFLITGFSTGISSYGNVSHPRIWVTPGDRAPILEKIETHAYAASLFEQLKERADSAVARHQADREGFLRTLPLDGSREGLDHPPFRTIDGDESDRQILMPYIQDAVDCGVLYFLTEDPAYARCAADIIGVFVSALARMERSENLGNGGLIYPRDHLKEARIIGAQIPVAYDFIQPFVSAGNRVFDIVSGGERPFPFADARKTFQAYVDMAIEVGHTGSNWSVLEASSLVGNLLCFDSEEKIAAYLPYYLTRQSERQDPLSTVAENFPNRGDIWPESLQYSRHVAAFSVYLMTILERLYPDLELARTYPGILEAPSKDYLLQYPNGDYIHFGDGHRRYRTDYPTFEKAYLLAEMAGMERYVRLYGSLIKKGLENDYDRSRLADRTFAATVYKSPLKLLWSVPELKGRPDAQTRPRTVELPFAGIYLQRNLNTGNPEKDGLMAFVGGGHYVHGHASGMNIELYGEGHVLGVDAGKGKYRTDIHENYYRIFAAHNTVISNGASASSGGWVNLGIEQLELVDMEPMPGQRAVSPDHSFSTTRFHDLHNLVARAEHKRTLAVIRTSPTSGYYVDIFRARSDTPGQFHDYVYHNIGESLSFTGTPDGFRLTPDPGRFEESARRPWKQNSRFRHPGWHFFEDVESSGLTDSAVTARFETRALEENPIYMDVYMNAGKDRSYTRAMAPPTKSGWRPRDPITEHPPVYDDQPTPTLIVRQEGEAWTRPFAFVYSPSGESAGTGPRDADGVQGVESLSTDGVFKGLMVQSSVNGEPLRQYILLPGEDGGTYQSTSPAISFEGHFGVITVNGTGELLSLYIGSGESLRYGDQHLVAGPESQSAYWKAVP
jgi:hypothetical protein